MSMDELIGGLQIELREQILKNLINIKVHEKEKMGWKVVHEEIKILGSWGTIDYDKAMVDAAWMGEERAV